MEESENFIHTKYGYCYYSIESDAAFIYNLYIEPEHRRKGHAERLIRLVIEEIKRTGYQGEILIEAKSREDSISTESLVAFYKKFGLKLLGGDTITTGCP